MHAFIRIQTYGWIYADSPKCFGVIWRMCMQCVPGPFLSSPQKGPLIPSSRGLGTRLNPTFPEHYNYAKPNPQTFHVTNFFAGTFEIIIYIPPGPCTPNNYLAMLYLKVPGKLYNYHVMQAYMYICIYPTSVYLSIISAGV